MGPIFALLAAFLATSKDVISKRVSFELTGTASAFASFLFALPWYALLLTIALLCGQSLGDLSRAFFIFVMLRSLTDATAEWCKMSALSSGDLSLVTCVLALTPAFLLITSPLITGEALTPNLISGVLLVVVGALTALYQPSSRKEVYPKRAVLFAFGAACFFSLNNCFDRMAVHHAPPIISGASMTLLSAVILFFAVRFKREPLSGLSLQFKPLLARGFLEVAFMVMKLTALQYLTAPAVSAIAYLSVLFNIISGHTLFAETHFARRLIAGILMTGGALLAALA